jgi:hypothetical protein
MCVRLFCAYLYLSQSFDSETDIFDKCQKKALEEIRPEISRYEANGDLDREKKSELTALFALMTTFLEVRKTRSFVDRLKTYSEESADPKTSLDKLIKSEDQFIPFKDPLFTFQDIANNIFYYNVAVAIDPNIMLNVVLANYDLYKGERHRKTLLDSIKKWKVKEAWNRAVSKVDSTDQKS